MPFFGVDLTGATISLIEACERIPDAENPDPLDAVALRSGSPVPAQERSLWDQLDHLLAVGQNEDVARLVSGTSVVPARIQQTLQPWSRVLAPMLPPGPGPDNPIAVAYPLRTAPLVSRHLPIVLGRAKFGADSAPEEGLFGVEAPIALLLEAIAQKRCQGPDAILLLTGSGIAFETTAVSFEREALPRGGELLRIQVHDTQSGTLPEPFSLRARLEARVGSALTNWRIVFAGAEPAEAASQLSAALGLAEHQLIALPDHAVGLGAVRFAGLARRRPALGDATSQLVLQMIAPLDIGLVGTNREQEWFWHRLVPAGSPLSSVAGDSPRSSLIIRADTPGPQYLKDVALVACSNPQMADHVWLTEDEWPRARLTLHELERARRSRGASPVGQHQWNFQIRGRDARARWGLLRWSIEYSAPNATAPPIGVS